MRRGTTVLLATALLGTGAVTSPAAGTVPVEIVPRDLTVTVTGLGPEGRTCQVDADLYVPAGVDADHPAPAVLTTNGFGGTKADQADVAQGSASRATSRWPTRGWASSTATCARSRSTTASTTGRRPASCCACSAGTSRCGRWTTRPARPSSSTRWSARTTSPAPVRPRRGDDRRLLRRAGAVRRRGGGARGRHRPVGRRRPADHLERPGLLPGAGEQRDLPDLGDVTGTGVPKYQWMALFTALGAADGLQDLPAVTDPAQLADLATGTARTSTPGCAPRCWRSPPPATRARRPPPSSASGRWPPTSPTSGCRPCSPRARPTPCSTCRSRWHLHRAARPGHAHRAGLAVLGPQRPDPAARRAGHAPPRGLRAGPAGAAVVRPPPARGGPGPSSVLLLPRLGARGDR